MASSIENFDKDKAEFWAQQESIAMHFNDLIMRWRLRVIGGLGALVTLAGFVVKQETDPVIRYNTLILVAVIFLCGWIGVAMLDLFYYRELLRGAVKSIIKLEKELKFVSMSRRIEREAKCGGQWAPWAFYALGTIALIIPLIYGIYQRNNIPTREEKAAELLHAIITALPFK